MANKRKQYTAEFKAKVVLELLEENLTTNEIASKYNILPKNVQQWKKQFLENVALAFDKSKVVKEYKQEINALKKDKEKLAKKLGEVVVERDWAVGKLKSLDLLTKKGLIKSESEVQAQDLKTLSLNKKLTMLNISKTAYYYKPIEPYSKQCEIELLHEIDEIYTKYPYYGTRRIKEALKRNGFKVGRKKLKKAYEILNIQAIYPKKKTTMANKEHHKYPYLLEKLRTRDKKTGKETIAVKRPNQVWSADITYVRLQNGYAYLAVIIDWYSKKMLAYKLSNMMDVRLTVSVLREALRKHGRPEIFNTDQGSQYTAQEHIKILKENGIEISMNSRGAEHR